MLPPSGLPLLKFRKSLPEEEMFLSKVEGSPSLELVNLVLEKRSKGEKIVSMAIGDPSSTTPKEIIDEAYSAMVSGDVHYVPSSGTMEVRQAIVSKVSRSNGIRAGLDETIFLTTKLSVFASLAAVSETPYDALVPDPGYFYSEPVILTGGNPIAYSLNDDFSLDLDEIRRRTTSKTKTILINSPSNPTGKILGKSELQELYWYCRDRDITIIADEAYEDIDYGVNRHFAVGSLESTPEIVVSLFSLSKSYSMTGWRAGYVVASKKIIHLITKFLENTVTCFPPFIQRASAFALNNGDRFILQFKNEYSRKKKILEEEIEKIPRLDLNRIEGAFYAFPELGIKDKNSVTFSSKLLMTKNVAVLPGLSFGNFGEGRIRISFSISEEELVEGLNRIRLFLAES